MNDKATGGDLITREMHEKLVAEARREGEERMAKYLVAKMALLCSPWSEMATTFMKIDIANWQAAKPSEGASDE